VPEGHGPDHVGGRRRAVVIFGVTLAVAGIFIDGVTIGVAVALATIFAVALLASGFRRKL
jgi:hypothetical protein